MWKQLEPNPPHKTYLFLSLFLITFAGFSLFIRNRLHLSEPPLATLFGIIIGPKALDFVDPLAWGFNDKHVQELTRVILGIECFTIGVELPQRYIKTHWKSLAMMLGPVMTFGWLICGLFVALIFKTDAPTALAISACLTPTDPVLSASILSNSQFSTRIPARIRRLLQAESGCNDGISFPFLYLGLSILTNVTLKGYLKEWLLITIMYQCVLGVIVGSVMGYISNRIFRNACNHDYIGRESFLISYILMAILGVGVASNLGLDDFLVTFSAGLAFAHDGLTPLEKTALPNVVDLLLNSAFFIFFGTMIPWDKFNEGPLSVGPLFGLLVLVLAFRRIPVMMAVYRFTPDIKTWPEALFAGHFGPMGVGALFLAIEARAVLETGTAEPLPRPPPDLPSNLQRAVDIIWPIICFIVLGSIMVHGLSTLLISIGGHVSRPVGERAPLIGGETDRLYGMIEDEGQSDDDSD